MKNQVETALNNSAMLVTLTISQWTARKFDKTVSAEVERSHQARDAGRYSKHLVAKDALEAISKIASAARTYHYKTTLPWGDNGDRLLPAILFEDYAKAIRSYKSQFEGSVRTFVRDYPQLVADARARLGTMYRPEDYPPVSSISERFSIATEFSPVPTSGDFRVDLNEEYVDSIKRDLETRLVSRQEEAVRHCYTRLKEVIGNIHERLADEDKVFRDTLITNAEELISILPALNITNDPALRALSDEVKELLVHPDRLRQDKTLRSQTADRAAEILGKFKFLG